MTRDLESLRANLADRYTIEREIGAGGMGTASSGPITRFTFPVWRRSTFDDRGTGFAVIGDGERYLVRVSPTAPGVALMQNWRALLQGISSSTLSSPWVRQ